MSAEKRVMLLRLAVFGFSGFSDAAWSAQNAEFGLGFGELENLVRGSCSQLLTSGAWKPENLNCPYNKETKAAWGEKPIPTILKLDKSPHELAQVEQPENAKPLADLSADLSADLRQRYIDADTSEGQNFKKIWDEYIKKVGSLSSLSGENYVSEVTCHLSL